MPAELGNIALPGSSLGDTLYVNSSGVVARLAGNTLATRKFLAQTGTGTGSATPVWDLVTLADLLLTIATQSDQETGSSLTALVTSARQRFHPSACKAWAKFSIGGGVVTVLASFGVSSITRSTAGNYGVTWANAFSSTNYSVLTSADNLSGTGNLTIGTVVQETTGIRILTSIPSTQSLVDASMIYLAAFGDQ